jgi:hypothetical protein
MDLSGCSGLTSVDELGKGISRLHQLTELKVDLSGCTSVDKLGKGISQLQQLTELKMNLYLCTAFTSVDELGKKHFPVEAAHGDEDGAEDQLLLVHRPHVGRRAPERHFPVEAAHGAEDRPLPVHALTSDDELGKGTAQLQRLTELKVCIFECSGLASVGELGKGIPSCGSPRSWRST